LLPFDNFERWPDYKSDPILARRNQEEAVASKRNTWKCFPLFVRFTSRDGNMMIVIVPRSAGAAQLYVPSIATDIFSVHGQCAFQPTVERSIAGRLSSRVHHSRPSMLRFLLTWPCVPFCTKLVRRSDYYYLVTWSTTTYGDATERNGGKNIHGMIDGSWLWLTNPFSCVLRITSATRVRLSTTRLCCHCNWPVGWFVGWRCRGSPPVSSLAARHHLLFFHSIHPSVFSVGAERRPSWPFFLYFIAATHCNSPLMYRCVCRSTHNEWHFMPSTSFLTTVQRERNGGGHRTHPPPDLSRLFFWLAFLSATRKKSILFINQKQFYFLFRVKILSWGGNPWLPSASGELLTKNSRKKKKGKQTSDKKLNEFWIWPLFKSPCQMSFGVCVRWYGVGERKNGWNIFWKN
jgi:hypothetical protein